MNILVKILITFSNLMTCPLDAYRPAWFTPHLSRYHLGAFSTIPRRPTAAGASWLCLTIPLKRCQPSLLQSLSWYPILGLNFIAQEKWELTLYSFPALGQAIAVFIDHYATILNWTLAEPQFSHLYNDRIHPSYLIVPSNVNNKSYHSLKAMGHTVSFLT